jgi:hypothetical protein
MARKARETPGGVAESYVEDVSRSLTPPAGCQRKTQPERFSDRLLGASESMVAQRGPQLRRMMGPVLRRDPRPQADCGPQRRVTEPANKPEAGDRAQRLARGSALHSPSTKFTGAWAIVPMKRMRRLWREIRPSSSRCGGQVRRCRRAEHQTLSVAQRHVLAELFGGRNDPEHPQLPGCGFDSAWLRASPRLVRPQVRSAAVVSLCSRFRQYRTSPATLMNAGLANAYLCRRASSAPRFVR